MKQETSSRGARAHRPLAAAALLLVLFTPPAAAVTTTAAGDVVTDTVWEGTVEVTGEVRVADGATLLVQPGTTVRFAAGQDEAGKPRTRLLVHGTLIAQGTATAPILFTSAAATPQAGDWGGIVFERSQKAANRISRAEIRYAGTGIFGSYAILIGQDLTIRDCVTGVWSIQNFKGQLLRVTVTKNESGLYFQQNSVLAVDDCQVTGNAQVGIFCHLSSSPAIRLSTIADNGERGVVCLQGSSPLIEGNTIRGHKAGIFMELQVQARIYRNLITGNETGIFGEKMTSPEIINNTITGNGTGIYCNYSTYPVVHGNNIHDNRTFGMVLGDNMSILMEEKIPYRNLGQAYFGTPPPAAALPRQNKKFQPFVRGQGGIVDARGNWWGKAATEEMAKLPPEGNSSVIEDFFDKPDTFFEGEKYRRDRIAFTPWETEPLKDAVLPQKSYSAIRGKVVSGGKPAGGVRVHAYLDPSGGFQGQGDAFSAPTATDGSFSLDIRDGSWYLVAKGPLPPFPAADPGAGGFFGFYGGNPVSLGPGGEATVNIQVVRRRPVTTTADPAVEKSLVVGTVTGPDGPIAGAALHVYTDASRQFRGPDLFGPQGAVIGGAGAKGEFSIELPPGTYYLVASKRKAGDVLGPLQPGDLHGWFDGNPLTVAAGAKTAVEIQVVGKLRETPVVARAAVAGTGIRGSIRDPAGKVPAGVYAFATTDPSFMIGSMPPYRSQPVGPDGSFSIDLPGGGTYYVSARSGHGGPPLPGEWHGFHGKEKPTPVIVEKDRTTEGIDVVVKKME